MKLVRYGPAGREKPGLIDAEGTLRDLSRKVKDIDGETLAPASLNALRKLDVKRLPAVKGRPRLGPCVGNVRQFIAIGLNFVDHARETNSPIPEHPIVFFKALGSIQGPNDPIMLPAMPVTALYFCCLRSMLPVWICADSCCCFMY